MNEIRNRRVADIVIAVVDGLREFPEAINAVSPQTVVRTCVIDLICDLKWQALQSAEHRLGVDKGGCFLKGARTICGEEDAMRAAFKQNDAKILFKRYDDAGKMRLAYPQTLGRPMKIQGGGPGQRRFQTI
jgi:hypothetical protein